MRVALLLALTGLTACSSGTTLPDSGGQLDSGVCNAATCTGCCQDGVCHPGNERVACGANGAACDECNLQQYCVQRLGEYLCTSSQCTAACDGGCCDEASGQCAPGTANTACGGNGGWCRGCATTCVNQACQ